MVFGIDETLERRRGPKIKSLGIYRDAVRSSRSHLVKASGLRWVSLMWLGHVPWAGRYWALPFLTVLAPLTVISPHPWLEYLKYGFLPGALQLGFPATHSATTGGIYSRWLETACFQPWRLGAAGPMSVATKNCYPSRVQLPRIPGALRQHRCGPGAITDPYGGLVAACDRKVSFGYNRGNLRNRSLR